MALSWRLGVGCHAAKFLWQMSCLTLVLKSPGVPVKLQAAAASFKSIVEAVLSWQTLHNEALAADILQILNLHKVSAETFGQHDNSFQASRTSTHVS
jgi:hypothetical protein